MKTLIASLLLTLLFTTVRSNAQTYHPFPDSNAIWRGGEGIPSQYSYYHYKLNGDTSIGSYSYNKIDNSGVIYYNWAPPGSPSYYSNGYIGAYRNDTLNKKVYYLEKDSTSEVLFYDFNLTIGDTIRGYSIDLVNSNNLPSNNIHFIVDSLDSVLINNSFRKTWYYHAFQNNSINGSYPAGIIIEGIGNTYDFLNGFISHGFEHNLKLTCYTDDKMTIGFYGAPHEISTGCYLVSIDETKLENKKTVISPNPFKSYIFLNTKLQINRISIVNIMGKTLFQSTRIENEKIDLSFLPNGIYFVHLNTENNNYTQKIIKH